MKNEIENLYNLIQIANHQYYDLDQPTISDYEYDNLIQQLIKLEKDYPQYKKVDSPTEKISANVDQRFQSVEHKVAMLSLDNVFSTDEFLDFDKKIKSLTSKKYSYVCELKIDGLAISLTYEDSLKLAVTRGNGKIGENVTHNILPIKTLPQSVNANIEVRGEVYISKEEFERINKNSTKQYANPRNLAAGTIRQLDQKNEKRNLGVFVYGLVDYKELQIKTYYESMQYLKGLGFSVNEKLKLCNEASEVVDYINDMLDKRHDLDYEIDGIVIKINEYDVQEDLGFTAKYPRWATAYKFKSDEANTILEDIFYTVGRTGKLTPNAKLKPVYLMGSTIARATLHNYQYIHDIDVRIGDTVTIIKAGDIIPRVVRVNQEFRKDQESYVAPTNCPSCDTSLVIIENDHYCLNTHCPAKKNEQLIYFASKDAFEIDGLGEKIVLQLVDKDIVKTPDDFFNLNYEKLATLDGFKEKSINNLLTAIENAKDVSLEKFITAIAISNVGLVTATMIANEFKTFEALKNATYDELLAIDNVGSITASEIVKYFNDADNLNMIDKMFEYGVKIKHEEIKIQTNDFTGKTVCVTGSFSLYKRDDIKAKFATFGCKVASSISKNTDYLIAGEKAGSKLTKAQELGTTIITEEELENIMK